MLLVVVASVALNQLGINVDVTGGSPVDVVVVLEEGA